MRIRLPLLAGALALSGCAVDAVSNAELGDPCTLRDAYSVKAVDGGYIRCEIVPGTSLHADEGEEDARFQWIGTTRAQYELALPGDDLVRIDGSSTVAPLSAVTAKFYETTSRSINGKRGARVSVGISGTGGGFEKFCNDETDISNASRAIKAQEIEQCVGNGIGFTEVRVANDGVAVVVSPDNDWATCLTISELSAIWSPDSKITNWSQVREGFPNVRLKLFGAGTDSGTFDSFTKFVNGESGVVRREGVSTSENDNVTVRGVLSERGSLGYFGYSYAKENSEKVRALAVDGGEGCVTPSESAIQDYTYPMARPLFMYVKNRSLESRAVVRAFVLFFVENSTQINRDALFVPLSLEQLDEIRQMLRPSLGTN
jgi:phosphate transport system substrate-binding protein